MCVWSLWTGGGGSGRHSSTQLPSRELQGSIYSLSEYRCGGREGELACVLAC